MFKKTVIRAAIATAVAASLGFATVASADPVLPGGTDLRIKFVDYENEVTQFGQELFGLINVTQILSSNGLISYWNGNGTTDGTQLVGYFENLIIGPDQTMGTGASFTGGNGALYVVPNGTFSPSTSPNTKDFVNQLCGGACPAPYLTFDFVPGINDSINGNATLQGAFAATNVQAGFGYLSVTGGTAFSLFDTNGFAFNNFANADMSFRSNFSKLPPTGQSGTCDLATSQGWAVCSDDPLNARTIPEPGSMALLGLSALLLGVARRKSKV